MFSSDFLRLVPYLAYFLCVCCDLKGSIRCDAGNCDVTQPFIFLIWFVGRSQSMERGVWLQEKEDVLNPGVEPWQANSKCFRLHGKNV